MRDRRQTGYFFTPTFDVKENRQVGVEGDRRSEVFILQNLLERPSKRLEPRPHSLHEEHPALLRESQQGSELGSVRSYWFLTQDVLLGKDRVLGVLVVVRVRGS